MKKFLILIVCVAMILPCTFSLVACKKKKTQIKPSGVDAQAIYTFAALTSAASLSSENEQLTNFNVAELIAESRPAEVENDIENLLEYVKMFEGFLLSNGTFNSQTSKPTEADGEFSSYSTKTVTTLPDISGKSVVYTMYYNETEKKNGTIVDDDEIEVSTNLNGILIVEKNEELSKFDIIGEKIVEIEDNETEVSIEFTTRSVTNPNEYIVVEQESEMNEFEFEYYVYHNVDGKAKLVSKTEIEIEDDLEDNEKKVELEFISLVNGVKNEIVYEIEKLSNNSLAVEYFKSNIKSRIIITKTEGGYQFAYENGYTEILS